MIKSYGKKQAILLDPLDYRLLESFAEMTLGSTDSVADFPRLLRGYLDEKISLGKVAETLGVSRFELMERFDHLGVPITIGPRNLEEARADVEAVRKAR